MKLHSTIRLLVALALLVGMFGCASSASNEKSTSPAPATSHSGPFVYYPSLLLTYSQLDLSTGRVEEVNGVYPGTATLAGVPPTLQFEIFGSVFGLERNGKVVDALTRSFASSIGLDHGIHTWAWSDDRRLCAVYGGKLVIYDMERKSVFKSYDEVAIKSMTGGKNFGELTDENLSFSRDGKGVFVSIPSSEVVDESLGTRRPLTYYIDFQADTASKIGFGAPLRGLAPAGGCIVAEYIKAVGPNRNVVRISIYKESLVQNHTLQNNISLFSTGEAIFAATRKGKEVHGQVFSLDMKMTNEFLIPNCGQDGSSFAYIE